MAKIIPSALISSIQGKWHGSCFQNWKGSITVRRNPESGKRKIQSTSIFKGLVNNFSGCFYVLSSDQRIGWRYYATLLPTSMSGFNAFLSRQVALSFANHPSLSPYFTAPCFYDPPLTPSPVYLCYYSNTGIYCLFWTYPNCVDVYVQGLIALQTTYSNEKYPKFHIFNIVPSSDLHVTFDASKYYGDTVFRFSARSINVLGEISQRSLIIPPPDLPASLSLVTPNGGESYTSGNKVNILWRCKSIIYISILFSSNGGSDYIPLATAVKAKSGSYSWTIPDLSSSDCLIKLLCSDTEGILDISDSTFEISNA
jgi:hypothetical protein